jgi:hypothetical protein
MNTILFTVSTGKLIKMFISVNVFVFNFTACNIEMLPNQKSTMLNELFSCSSCTYELISC